VTEDSFSGHFVCPLSFKAISTSIVYIPLILSGLCFAIIARQIVKSAIRRGEVHTCGYLDGNYLLLHACGICKFKAKENADSYQQLANRQVLPISASWKQKHHQKASEI
jgi:hypothetical protein